MNDERRVRLDKLERAKEFGMDPYPKQAERSHEVAAVLADFDALTEMTDQDVIRQLTAVRGIGNWSAKMYLIFVLNRPDVLPFEDVAFLQGYGWLFNTDDWRPAAVKKKCRKWRPYTSIAARYMYEVLDRGLTKEKFHLFKD